MWPYGISYFCDDIRFEQQNKYSLVGCYGPDIILRGSPPFVLPKFCILIQVRFPPENRSAGKILVYEPSQEQPLWSIEWPEEHNYVLDEPSKQDVTRDKDVVIERAFVYPCVFSPLMIHAEGHIKVRMEYQSQIIRLGALRVKIQHVQQTAEMSA